MKRFRKKQKTIYKLIYFFSNIDEFCRKSDLSNNFLFVFSIREQICYELSTVLTQRETMHNQLETVTTRYPTLILNDALMSLVRSKVLKKTFGDYYNACLRGLVRKTYLQ